MAFIRGLFSAPSFEDIKQKELKNIQEILDDAAFNSLEEKVKQSILQLYGKLKETHNFDSAFALIPEDLRSVFREGKLISQVINLVPGFLLPPAEKLQVNFTKSLQSLYTSTLPHLSQNLKEKEHVLILAQQNENFKEYSQFFWTVKTTYETPERDACVYAGTQIGQLHEVDTFEMILQILKKIRDNFSSLINASDANPTSTSSTSSSTSALSDSAQQKDKWVAAKNKAEELEKKVLNYMKENNFKISKPELENEKKPSRRPGH